MDTNGEQVFVNSLIDYWIKYKKTEIIIFDIGANIGKYTTMMLEKTARNNIRSKINVFEPTNSCFDILSTLYLGNPDVVLNRAAVSVKNGTAEIFYDQPQSGFSSLHKRNLSPYSIRMDRSEIVETIRLDTYLEKEKITHIDFLKIDIEGHELAALIGMGDFLSGKRIDFIQFEYGGANLDSHTSLMELYGTLEKADFIIAKIMPKGLDIRSYSPWMDNFQYANYVAISKYVANLIL